MTKTEKTKPFLQKIISAITLLSISTLLAIGAVSATAAFSAQAGYVRGEGVIVRKQPSTQSEKLSTIDKAGTKVKVVGTQGSFFRVEYNNEVGYISDEFLILMSFTTSNLIGDKVNLREKPSTTSEKIAILPAQSELAVFDQTDEFYLICVDDKMGYVAKEFVELNAIETMAQETIEDSDLETPNKEEEKTQEQKTFSKTVDPSGLSQEDLYLAAKLIYAEGRDQSAKSFESMATVLYNRLKSSKFPNTIEGIVYQKGQFTVVKFNSWSSIKPNEKAIAAIEKVFVQGEVSLPPEVMFFKSARLSRSWGARKYYETVGGNMYYS